MSILSGKPRDFSADVQFHAPESKLLRVNLVNHEIATLIFVLDTKAFGE